MAEADGRPPYFYNARGGCDWFAKRDVWDDAGMMGMAEAARQLGVPYDLALAWAVRYRAYIQERPDTGKSRHYVHKTFVQVMKHELGRT